MAKDQLTKEANFLANYLAKFEDSYEQLGFSTQKSLHEFIGGLLDIGEASFRQLRDEYDGFYANRRKGYPDPEKRRLRVAFKKEFDSLGKREYTEKVKLILKKKEIPFYFEDELGDNVFSQGVEELYEEGKANKVFVNSYERNLKARNKSLEFHNNTCTVCGYKAFDVYGRDIFILEVHHTTPLSEIKRSYIVNPELDLKPLCPNCHRAIHAKNPAYTIEELKEIIGK